MSQKYKKYFYGVKQYNPSETGNVLENNIKEILFYIFIYLLRKPYENKY